MLPRIKIKHEAVAETESALIREVRLGTGSSRVELARQLNLAPSTVGLYVDRLVEDGFLSEGPGVRGGAGRPPVVLRPNPKAGQFVGVDIEARQITATAIDFSQRRHRLLRRELGASERAKQVVEQVKEIIQETARGKPRLLGVGVAVPGIIDSRTRTALHYEHIRGWRNLALGDDLSRRFRAPVYLENNIRSMALAERWFGLAKDTADFVCLGIRSGIGAGVMVNGSLLHGADNLCGEIGGWPCFSAGENGEQRIQTFEQMASTPAILARLEQAIRSGRPTSITLNRNRLALDEALRGAADGDALVCEVLCDAAEAVGRVISQFNLLLNPQQIILAGPLADLGESFLAPIRQMVERLTPPKSGSIPPIVASELGSHGGALGAAALAMHQWKPARKQEAR